MKFNNSITSVRDGIILIKDYLKHLYLLQIKYLGMILSCN